MSGFQFTDDDDPQPQAPPPKAAPPASVPPPQPTKAVPPPPPNRPAGASPAGGPPPPPPRPGQPGAPPSRPAPPGGTPRSPAAPGAPAGAPGAPKRQVPHYGEGGVVQSPSAQPAHPTPAAMSHEGPANAPRDKTGETLYEFGQTFRSALDSLEPLASWVLRIAFGVGALCLAYLLVMYFGGAIKSLPFVKDQGTVKVVTNNLTLCARGLTLAIVAAYVASLFLGYEDNKLGAIGAAIGAVMHFGVPLGIRFVMDPKLVATAAIAAQFRSVGMVMLVIGLVRASIDVLIWMITLPDRMRARADVGFARPAEAKQLAVAREANMFSPCWKLPFCRETIRKQCPAFLAHKTCWKFGRGCYCDEEMIGRIIRGETLEAIKAPTRQSRTGKPPCGRCYIFLEHQTHKFRMLSPLALPATIVIMYVAWPVYQKLFGLFNKALGSLWTGLSFNPQSLTPENLKPNDPGALNAANPYQVNAEQVQHLGMIFIAVLLGFFLLIYISKFIEWAVYKAKL